MTLADVYLICFIVGFGLTVIATLSGTHHVHLPGLHGHTLHMHGLKHGSVFSFGNLAAFLTWFGGVGYLITRFSGIWLWFVFFIAISAGLVGGAIVFWISVRLMAQEHPMDSADYDMIGVYGCLTSSIRDGGIGEMSFSQQGLRRSAPARSED